MTQAKLNAVLLLALALGIASCADDAPRIRQASDLPEFAARFKMSLEGAGIKPVCSEAGLQEVEFYLDKMPEGVQQAHVPLVGAYLGQCMIDNYGGEWVKDVSGTWAVQFSQGNMAFPLVSVQDYVNDPNAGDSFAAVYGRLPESMGLEEKSFE